MHVADRWGFSTISKGVRALPSIAFLALYPPVASLLQLCMLYRSDIVYMHNYPRCFHGPKSIGAQYTSVRDHSIMRYPLQTNQWGTSQSNTDTESRNSRFHCSHVTTTCMNITLCVSKSKILHSITAKKKHLLV